MEWMGQPIPDESLCNNPAWLQRARRRTRGDGFATMQSPWVRLWAKVDASGDCWIWNGSRDRNGYGCYKRPDRTAGGAHRIIYELMVDPAEGLDLDHLCRNPACVNPDHLEPVTHKENLARGPKAKREKKLCRQGLHDITTPESKRWVKGQPLGCKVCAYDATKRYQERRKLAAS